LARRRVEGGELPLDIIAAVNQFILEKQYTWRYITLGRCPLSIFCSGGTPPRGVYQSHICMEAGAISEGKPLSEVQKPSSLPEF
jgi:hypothetical protein